MDTALSTNADYFKKLEAHCEGGIKAGELVLFTASQRPTYRYSSPTWFMMGLLRKHIENGGTVTYINYEGPDIR